MIRRMFATLLVMAAVFVVAVEAQDPVPIKTANPAKSATRPGDDRVIDKKAVAEEVAREQARLARQFKEFESALLRLAQRLEGSNNPQDKDKAMVLKKAIEKAAAEGTETKFSKFVEELNSSKALTFDGVSKAMQENEGLARDLQDILDIILRGKVGPDTKAVQMQYERLLELVKHIIREQELVRAKTERTDQARLDNQSLGKMQQGVTKSTEAVERGFGKNDKGGEMKGKPGDFKPEGKPGEAPG